METYLSWTLQNWAYRSSAMSNFYMDSQDQTQTPCAAWSVDNFIFLDFSFHFFSFWYLQIFPDFLLFTFYPGCTLYPGKDTNGVQSPLSALWDYYSSGYCAVYLRSSPHVLLCGLLAVLAAVKVHLIFYWYISGKVGLVF